MKYCEQVVIFTGDAILSERMKIKINRYVPLFHAALFETECDVVEGQTLRESNYR